MTERERQERLEEMKRRRDIRMNHLSGQTQPIEAEGNLFGFRLYVTVILTGAIFALSFFETETAREFCGQIKTAITYEYATDEIEQMKEQVMEVWNQEIWNQGTEEFLQEEEKIYEPDVGGNF